MDQLGENNPSFLLLACACSILFSPEGGVVCFDQLLSAQVVKASLVQLHAGAWNRGNVCWNHSQQRRPGRKTALGEHLPRGARGGPRQCCCGLIGGNLLSCGVLHQCSSRRAPGGDAVVMPDGLLEDCKDLLRCSL